MSKKLWLSNSQINTYSDCNYKWFLQKQKRLRPNYKPSALLMGSAIDSAVEHILLKKEGDYYEEFLTTLSEFDINGTKKYLPDDLLSVRFFASDIDIKLIEQDWLDGICVDVCEIEPVYLKEFIEYCKQQRRSKTALSKSEQLLFNNIAYKSLKIKGTMLLEVLKEWIDKNVKEVHSVQKKISINNDNGDVFIGYLDFIVTLSDDRKVLIDLKTSSNPKAYYPSDSAEKSRQLGIYAQEEGVYEVAYLVVDKKIRVREPRVRLHFVEGIITEEHLDEVFEEIEDYTTGIKEKLEIGESAFKKNRDSCMKFSGCEYFNYCKKGCTKGLEYVKIPKK